MVAQDVIINRRDRMGAKYLPSIKDIKATQRFQQKQSALPKLKKNSAGSSAKRRKK